MTHSHQSRTGFGRIISSRMISGLGVAALAATGAALAPASGQDTGQPGPDAAAAAAAAIAAGRLPAGYRDWRLVSVAQEEGKLDDLRAILGNDIAVTAFRARHAGMQAGGAQEEGAQAEGTQAEGTQAEGTQAERQPFPDGTVIARIAWDHEALAESAAAFGKAQSYVAVHPKNGVQFMIKDAKKYAATGGWGFAQFDDGKPAAPSRLTGCFACHQAAQGRDFVFTRYAP